MGRFLFAVQQIANFCNGLTDYENVWPIIEIVSISGRRVLISLPAIFFHGRGKMGMNAIAQRRMRHL
jgi:hypothetical protein